MAELGTSAPELATLDELRLRCNVLQHAHDDLRARFDALQGVVDRIRLASDGNVAERFAGLAEKWKRETRLLSNATKKAIHPAYQQIIAMGYSAVPFILQDLAVNGPDDWFWALTTVTGENPITENMCGQMQAMTEAWLRWGLMKGYLTDSTQRTKPPSPVSSGSATA